DVEPDAYADAFNSLTTEEALGEAGVEFFVPVHGAAEAHGYAEGDDFVDAADGITFFFGAVDVGFHLSFNFRAGNAEFAFLYGVDDFLVAKAVGIDLNTA